MELKVKLSGINRLFFDDIINIFNNIYRITSFRYNAIKNNAIIFIEVDKIDFKISDFKYYLKEKGKRNILYKKIRIVKL